MHLLIGMDGVHALAMLVVFARNLIALRRLLEKGDTHVDVL